MLVRQLTLLRLVPLVLVAILVAACESLERPEPAPPPEPLPPGQFSCSFANGERELAEASASEVELACLIINHAEQQRPQMYYDPVLGAVARARAEDMAAYGYYGGEDHGLPYPPHVDRHGYGPNHYLCEAGYRADLYCSSDPFANNVESIAFGPETAAGVLTLWYNSPLHKRHLLGEVEYFLGADYYGIGHAVTVVEDGGYLRDFWVVLTAYPP